MAGKPQPIEPEDEGAAPVPVDGKTEDVQDVERIEALYGADQIRLLEGLEAVRMRPAMYISGTDAKGMHHLFVEVTDNSVDEAMAGHCDRIDVTLHADDSMSVRDNGRGIPVGINSQTGLSGVELALTKLHAGGKFGDGGYKVSGGLHGVGVSCVNALSEWLTVDVWRNGKQHRIGFKRGITTEPLKVVGEAESDETGTLVRWKSDYEIFGEIHHDPDSITRRLRELAYLNKEVTLTFTNERDVNEPDEEGNPQGVRTETFHYRRGMAEIVEHLNE